MIVIIIILLYLYRAALELYVMDLRGTERAHAACLLYSGRTANCLFMYAFQYSMARSKNLRMVIEGEFNLTDDFILGDWDPYPGLPFDKKYCPSLRLIEDKYDCGYDRDVENFKEREDVRFSGFFQSWRYWVKYETDIRRLFQFKSHVKMKATLQVNSILHKYNYDLNRDKITLVGIHIRRGDYEKNQHFVNFGYKLAPSSYIVNAMNYMRERFGKCLFIVCSNDIKWSKSNLEKFADVHFVEGNSPAEDMALLAQTNHTIMTVGTFGWWIGFLTNGVTVYYKHPFRSGTGFASQFPGESTRDHFYPGWIGME